HGGAEAPVAPGLQRELDLEAEQEGELVVVQPARRADVDEQAVELPPLEAAVLECGGDRAVRQRGEALLTEVAEADGADAGHRDRLGRRHGRSRPRTASLSAPSAGGGRRMLPGVRSSLTGIPAVRTPSMPVSTIISRAR